MFEFYASPSDALDCILMQGKKRKRSTTKKASGEKRGPTAYMVFSMSVREQVRKDNPDASVS